MFIKIQATGRPEVKMAAGETFEAALTKAKTLAKSMKGTASVTLVKG
jgi:hypothetical protein